jgi:RNA polymerase sigma factor (sigma-70 family)
VNERSDLELVQEFAQRGAESAFASLVQRHLNLVYSVALRLAADSRLAEDVSQSVFVALAQQSKQVASKLSDGMPLSAWLHLTTRNLAAKAVRTETRRRAREESAAVMHNADLAPDNDRWDELAPHLDHALAELAEADRNAILLRFYEGKTARQIGEQLQLSEDAAQKRVGRAVERLRQRLVERGLPVSVAALTLALAGNAIQAAPVALLGSVTAAALAASIAAPAAAAALTVKVASTFAMTKLQTAAVVAFAGVLALPIAVQHTTLTRLQAELATPHLGTPSPATGPAAVPRQLPETETQEFARLRRQADDLRLALKQAREKAEAGPAPPGGPVLLQVGRTVPLAELVYAGDQTPEAALQSLLSSFRDGDPGRAFSLMLDQPSEEDRRMLSSPEGQEQAAEMLKSEVKELTALELLEQRPITERRVQLVMREVRTNGVSTNVMNFGHAAAGWRQIL